MRNLKTYIALLFLMLSFSALKAQVTLKGRVINPKNKEALSGANVFIDGTSKGVVTNHKGFYEFQVPKGKNKITCSFIGFHTISKVVDCTRAETTLNFELKEQNRELTEVEVKASSNKAIIREIVQSPMSVTVIDGATIRGRSSGLQEVLTRTSGIKIRQEGGLGSRTKISVHGLEGKRVGVFINGFPLNTPDGSFDINEIPIDVIERIEVYKGIVPAEYGGDGLGGAINIETREVDCDLVAFTHEISNFDTYRTFNAVRKKFDKPGIQLGLALLYSRSDNDYSMDLTKFDPDLPKIPYSDVTRNNDFYSSRMIVGTVVFDKLWFDEIEFEVAAYKNRKELQQIRFDSRSAHTYGTNLINIFHLVKEDFLVKGLNFKSSMVVPIINTHFVDTSRVIYSWDPNLPPSPQKGESSDEEYNLTDDKQREFLHRLNLQYTISEKHRINLNNQFGYSKYLPNDEFLGRLVDFELKDFPSISRTNIAGLAHEYFSEGRKLQNAFILKSYYINSKVYQSDVRLLNEENNGFLQEPPNSNIKNHYWGFSEGLSYEFLPGIRAKLSYSSNYRLPDARELFGDGITIRSASDLKPEKSKNFNVGLLLDKENLFNMKRIQFEANGFYTSMEDLIRLEWADFAKFQYMNLDESVNQGIDADLKVDFTDVWYGYFNATLQNLRNTKKYETEDKGQISPKYNKRVPQIPWFYFNYGFEYHRADWIGKGELSRIYFDASYVHDYSFAWKFDASKATEHLWKIPSYHTFNLGLQQSFLDNKLALNFEVNNITNQTVLNNFRLPLPGRTYRLKLIFNWFRDKSEQGAMGF